MRYWFSFSFLTQKYTVFQQILPTFEKFPQQKFSLLGKKLKFAATIWTFYNFQIQKRIVSAETIRKKGGW